MNLARIAECQAARDAADRALHEALQAWATATCPLKLNTIVSLEGRRTKRGIITSIEGLLDMFHEPYIYVRVKPLRADGTPASVYTTGFEWKPNRSKS
jgi:hypothetical protein